MQTRAPGGRSALRRRQHPRRPRFLLVGVAAVLLLVASACEFEQLPDGGFRLKPDNPTGEKLLIIGDSLIRQPSLSVAFGSAHAGVETLIQPTNTSGLISGPVHWNERAAQLIDEFHPTVVLIGFTGNLTAPFWPGYGPPGAEGSPEWNAWIQQQMGSPDYLARYTAAAIELTDIFHDAGVEVYWVEAPVLPPSYGIPSAPDKLWAKWQAEIPVAEPGVNFLSARPSISNIYGVWMRYKVICNVEYEIRSFEWDGGVHFTADGAGTYGRALTRSLAAAEGWPAPPAHCPGWPD